MVGFLLVTGISNALFPQLTESHQDKIARKLAVELAQKVQAQQAALDAQNQQQADKTPDPAATKKRKGKKDKSSDKQDKSDKTPPPKPDLKNLTPKETPSAVLEKINEHHLSWYYLTDGNQKPLPSTRTFAPDLPAGQMLENSRNLVWRGQDYYESVAPVTTGANLHVGFYSGPAIGLSGDPLEAQVPFVVALILLFSMCLGFLILFLFSITLPIASVLKHHKLKDNETGMTPGKLSLAAATAEVRNLVRLLDDKDKKIEDRNTLLKERENTIKQLNARFEQEMTQAKKEKTVLYLKEAENQFIDRLTADLEAHTAVIGVSDTLLAQLHNEFPTSFEFALFFNMNRKGDANLTSHIGFSNNPLDVYKGLGVMKVAEDDQNELCRVLDPSAVKETQFKEIAELTSARYVLISPLRFQQKKLAFIVVFFRGQDQSLEHITRILNRASHVTAKALHHITVYEEQVESARTDELTGFPNKNYLPHLLPQLVSHSDGIDGEKRPFSLFLVEGHDVLAINEKYGRPAGDTVIQELGRRIDKLLNQRRTETMGSWGDHLIRYQGAQFLVILRQVDSKKATIFAQRLRQVLETDDYPCGVGRWSMAIGITSFPEDTSNPEELIVNLETALSYARGQSERNKIAHINAVPKAFRSAKLASNLGGSLDVFDPAALMQSLSISRKSGILTVTNPDGKMFWCYLENGRPTKARMGKFSGQPAIIEFLVLFESGEFAFSDLTSIDKQTLDDIGKLPKSFDVPGSLERALMDGALARDHYTSAHDVIKQLDLFVWPQAAAKKGGTDVLAPLRELKDPPSPDEEKAMKEILSVSNGKIQLKTIFERLDTLPTHTLWRGAALLVQHEIIQLKKLATSMAL
jgi:diguanylate cyclase (GGDEF)-like protein